MLKCNLILWWQSWIFSSHYISLQCHMRMTLMILCNESKGCEFESRAGRNCRWGEWMYSALSTFNTTTEVPLSKAPNPQMLPGRRSINGCPLLRVCVHVTFTFTHTHTLGVARFAEKTRTERFSTHGSARTRTAVQLKSDNASVIWFVINNT